MTAENKVAVPLEPATTATMRRCSVRLNELTLVHERYCHRDEDELEPKNLELFMDSLVLEGGVRVPIEYAVDPQKQKVVVAGHKRVTACRLLAKRNQPGFTDDMVLPAVEMVGATPADMLVESLSDNNNRTGLRSLPRLKAVKSLDDAGVEVKRAARALGVSDQTYQRDLRVVRHGWLFQHVMDSSIAPTVADKLIVTAEETKRIAELKEDLDEWIADKKKMLKEENKKRKAANRKPLSEAEMAVKNHLEPHVVEYWVRCIKENRRFDSETEWEYKAGVDKNQLQISPVNIDLNTASADMVAKILGGLSLAVKQLLPYAQERAQIEQHRGPRADKPAPYDFDILRANGMAHIADRLEEKYRSRLQDTKDGEEDPTHGQVEERTEEDLAESIELPQEGQSQVEAQVEQESPVEPTPTAQTATPPSEKKDKPAPKKGETPAAKGKPKEKGS